jgi:hypothetical protein
MMADEEKKSTRRGKSAGSAETQFKKGTSGHSGGRGHGVKNRATIIREVLNEKVTANIGGKKTKIGVAEAFTRTLVIDALKGDHKSILRALTLWEETETKLESASENAYLFGDADREVIKALYDRMKECEEPT